MHLHIISAISKKRQKRFRVCEREVSAAFSDRYSLVYVRITYILMSRQPNKIWAQIELQLFQPPSLTGIDIIRPQIHLRMTLDNNLPIMIGN